MNKREEEKKRLFLSRYSSRPSTDFSQETSLTIDEAEEAYKRYFKRYPRIRQWFKRLSVKFRN